ncbi:MAG: metallophosphoesterase family protein [Nitrososphaerota archaeon]|nr:metallophosphoesterase family protein [Nitrososphaerota archaeon]
MRRVAFISDVHSNLEALEAVLRETEGAELYCLGDLVGYGADPNGVVKRLREAGVVAVRGNHDEAVVTGDASWFNAKAAMAAKWTSKVLSDDNRDYLRRLPLQIRTKFERTPAHLTHGSPDDNLWEYVEPETHTDLFGHYLGKLEVRLIGLGHTHRPFVWSGELGTVFNPGSVGQPRDGDPRASYALVDFENGEVRPLRVKYDVEAAAAKIRTAGLPEPLAARLFEGR